MQTTMTISTGGKALEVEVEANSPYDALQVVSAMQHLLEPASEVPPGFVYQGESGIGTVLSGEPAGIVA